MREESMAEEGAAPESPQGTLAALLTASLSARLAEAVSRLVGAPYAARIVRVEPKEHGGADVLVTFFPRPPESTIKIELGEEVIEIPLPSGLVDDPTSS